MTGAQIAEAKRSTHVTVIEQLSIMLTRLQQSEFTQTASKLCAVRDCAHTCIGGYLLYFRQSDNLRKLANGSDRNHMYRTKV